MENGFTVVHHVPPTGVKCFYMTFFFLLMATALCLGIEGGRAMTKENLKVVK